MFVEVLLFLGVGIGLGVVTGLIPGIHPNLMILFVPLLSGLGIGNLQLVVVIVSMAMTNSIVDFIPSILLGAPEAGTSLSVLPGHSLLMEGKGYDAIKKSVVGGLIASVVCIGLIPLLFLVVPVLYMFLKEVMAWVLIAVIGLLVYREENKMMTMGYFLLAGILGILNTWAPLSNELKLLPLLTGLFAFSMLLNQIWQKSEIPEQVIRDKKVDMQPGIRGTMAGVVSGILPGIGPSQAAVFTGVEKKGFITALGAITTANIFISFLALRLIGHGRSGVARALESITGLNNNTLILVVIIAMISVGVACFLTLEISKIVLKRMHMMNYTYLSLGVLGFLNAIIFYFTGYMGLGFAWTAGLLGLSAIANGVKRSFLLGALILPTILFYIGLL